MESAGEYVSLVEEFCLSTGVRRQFDAFKGERPLAVALCWATEPNGVQGLKP